MRLSRLSIPYRAARGTGIIFFAVVFSMGSVFSGRFEMFLGLAALVVAAVAATLTWEYLVWRNFEYFVTDDSVKIKKGVFRKSDRDIPLRRVQNVDIKRNLVQRVLGIAQVNFETAGGQETEASLRFVEYPEAEEVQRKIRRLKKGLEEHEESEEKLLYSMGFKDMILLGLMSVETRAAFGIFFLLSVFGGAAGSAIESANIAASMVFLFLGVAMLLAVWIGSAFSAVTRYFGFEIRKVDDALEYERGLFNRTGGSIPFEKLQSLTVEENPLKRFFGYATLKIETAGYSGAEARQKGSEAAIPLAPREEVLDFADMLLDFGSLDIRGMPRNALERYAARYTIVSLIAVVAAYLVNAYVFGFDYWLLFLLLPLGWAAARFKHVHRGYADLEDHFVVRNGFWNRKTRIVPYYRMQNLVYSQTIFQKRWKLASLVLDTAGGGFLRSNAKAIDMDEFEAEKVAGDVYERFRESLYL